MVQSVASGSTKYYYLAGPTGSYSTDPGSDAANWTQVNVTGTTILSIPPSSVAYMSPDPTISALDQNDWLDVYVLSVFTGTFTPQSVNAAGSSTTVIKTAAGGLTAGQVGTFITGIQTGRSFVVSSSTTGGWTVTNNYPGGTAAGLDPSRCLTAGPTNGDLFTLNAISAVGVSTPTTIYTAVTLTSGRTYTMATGSQAGRYFTVVSGPSSGAYVVTGNLLAGPAPGDIFGPGLVPQGLHVALEIDENPAL